MNRTCGGAAALALIVVTTLASASARAGTINQALYDRHTGPECLQEFRLVPGELGRCNPVARGGPEWGLFCSP